MGTTGGLALALCCFVAGLWIGTASPEPRRYYGVERNNRTISYPPSSGLSAFSYNSATSGSTPTAWDRNLTRSYTNSSSWSPWAKNDTGDRNLTRVYTNSSFPTPTLRPWVKNDTDLTWGGHLENYTVPSDPQIPWSSWMINDTGYFNSSDDAPTKHYRPNRMPSRRRHPYLWSTTTRRYFHSANVTPTASYPLWTPPHWGNPYTDRYGWQSLTNTTTPPTREHTQVKYPVQQYGTSESKDVAESDKLKVETSGYSSPQEVHFALSLVSLLRAQVPEVRLDTEGDILRYFRKLRGDEHLGNHF